MRKQLLLLFCLFSAVSFAANHWDKRTSIDGSKRERSVSFTIGNRGYVALGQDTLNLMMNDLWEYDPGSNTWTQKANFPGAARRDAAAFSIGTKGYVGTGVDNADANLGMNHSDFWEYSPATNTWTSKAAFPGGGGGGVYYATGFALLGKGYLCCGKLGPSYYSNELWQYDPGTNAWTNKAPFPGGVRYGGGAFVIGNYAYYGLGTDENMFTTDFYRYDPATNTWTSRCAFPGSGRFNLSSFTINNLGYFVFGSDGGYKDELWEYDPNDDYWYQRASHPGGGRRSAIAFTINNRGFAGTGKGLTGVRRDFWEYIPTPPAGIDEEYNETSFSLYPNPAIDNLHVLLNGPSNDNMQLEIYSLTGQLVYATSLENNEASIDCSQFVKGNYVLRLQQGYQLLGAKTFIIQ